MFRLLILVAVGLALLDPLLLLLIALGHGLLPALAILLLPGFLGGHLLRLQRGAGLEGLRVAAAGPGSVWADQALLFVAGVLLVYHGPLSSILGLLLLVPPLRRGCGLLLARLFRERMASGSQFSIGAWGSQAARGTGAAQVGQANWPAGGLKSVEGEALDSRPLDEADPGGPQRWAPPNDPARDEETGQP